jgi:arylsulfatase A-like enzyme
MTGQLQETHGVVSTEQRLPDDAVVLADLFEAAGYTTAAFVQMVYASDVYGLGQGFGSTPHHDGRTDHSTRDMIRDLYSWLGAHRDDDLFLYVHLRRPHSPYDPDPMLLADLEAGHPLSDGSRDDVLRHADSQVASRGDISDADQERVEQLYRANLRTVDREVGALIDSFERLGNTLIVLTSDHGEALGQHDHYGHGPKLFAEHIDIPLIFAGPGIEPGVDQGPASTIDMLPTLADLCALDLPPGHLIDGVSLASRLTGLAGKEPADDTRLIPLSAKHPGRDNAAAGVIQDEWKFVLDPDGRPRLSNRLQDPTEQHDLSAQNPGLVERMRRLVQDRRDRFRQGSKKLPAPRVLTEDQQKSLQELGYLR